MGVQFGFAVIAGFFSYIEMSEILVLRGFNPPSGWKHHFKDGHVGPLVADYLVTDYSVS